MPRPITKKQLSDFWAVEYSPKNHCCLCGNRGIIDTRNKVFTPAGYECGARVFCICPNGQTIKRQAPNTVKTLTNS